MDDTTTGDGSGTALPVIEDGDEQRDALLGVASPAPPDEGDDEPVDDTTGDDRAFDPFAPTSAAAVALPIDPDFDVGKKSVVESLAYVRDDAGRARQVLQQELDAEKPRTTLVEPLERLLGDG